MRAPRHGEPSRLYIAAEDNVIGAVLTQETKGKEHRITYLSRGLLDAETRYTFVEKLCLCLYYACTKVRHYLLSSMCTIACQTDVIKYMLHRPILSGRIGKWAYGLIEYDLAYESLKSMKGQIVADFIVEHRIDDEHEIDVNLISLVPWRLYFDGSVCDDGQGVGIVYISPHGDVFEASCRLEYFCTNNQAEYEALLFGLEMMVAVGATHVEAFGDSLLIVQQVNKVFQCIDGSLNMYLDKCLDIISTLDYFNISHISRQDNSVANDLAQQASGYHVSRGAFHRSYKPMFAFAVISEAELTPIDSAANEGSSAGIQGDWRRPIIEYLQDPSKRMDKAVRQLAFKYTLLDNDLYRRMVDGILLKCLDEDQARVAMGEVHEGICGTHQSAHKMKWLLRRAGFYWPTMINDCFGYYKGCESCQKFGDIQLAPAAMLHPIVKP